jgi:flagellar protein FlaJ
MQNEDKEKEKDKNKADNEGENTKKNRKFNFLTRIEEDKSMMLDLLNIQTYMSSVATAKVSRDKIFELAGQQEGTSSKYFKTIHLLAKNYGYSYVTACKIVSDEATHPVLKDFLIRFANALATGEEELTFLRGELEKQVELYTNKYLSDIETLKKWTDGYAALLVSVILVIAVFLISSLLFNMGDPYTSALLSGFLFCFISIMGVYVIYRVSPYEKTVHSLQVKSKEQAIAHKMCMIILPIMAISSLLLLLLGVDPWIIFLLIAILLTPIGITGLIDDKKIERRDRDISTLLKSLGAGAGITGTTLSVAISNLNREAVGTLGGLVKKLDIRLRNGINPKICWYHFKAETGSQLVHQSTTVFLDTIDLGGEPTEIGTLVAQSSLRISLLRAKRKLHADGFVNLIIPLHATMSGVIMFIYEVIFSFSNAMTEMMTEQTETFSGAQSSMPAGIEFFNIGGGVTDLDFISKYVTAIILVSTVANAIAAKCAAGGSNYKLCFYVALLFLVSAIVLFVIPILTTKLFVLQTTG